MKKYLITGAAGFIGFHLSKRLLEDGNLVYGIDNLNDYYDVKLKAARLASLQKHERFVFQKSDIADSDSMLRLFQSQREASFDVVINLAAQAGVRYSLINPHSYIKSNILGFTNVLECCRHYKTKHLVFASSSSVYGINQKIPFSVEDHVDHPVSLYAATKRTNELMAHSYAHLYGLPCTGLRFFTVYGPWGRPDMAYFSFTKAIMENKPIQVFNNGELRRDFTYIDDIIECIVRLTDKIPRPNTRWDKVKSDPGSSFAPYKLYNIGNNSPVGLNEFILILETALGMKAQKDMQPMQKGDVMVTYADVDELMHDVGFKPSTTLEEGLKRFVAWYREYYQ